ncbi:MAG: polyisoprenoid-binding protein [Cytophagales bacterium]|nr:MAG: polyisoprenoid-binding protein [Cytophagales bacterium]
MATWLIDAAHSTIEFKIKYLLISTVTGVFTKFDAKLESENDDFNGAKISFSAEVNSINTNNAERDEHLKSEDFFSATTFPRITFRSLSFHKIGGTHYKLIGEMTIRNYLKVIELDVDYGGKVTDSRGNTRAGFEIIGKISRRAYGLLWDAVTETGGIMVGDEVKLFLSVQMVKML